MNSRLQAALHRALDRMVIDGELHEADGRVMTPAAYAQAVREDPTLAERAMARRTELVEQYGDE